MAATGKALAALNELRRRGLGNQTIAAMAGIGAAAKSQDAEASFIGKMAKTFGWDAHTLAKKLEDSGASRDEIWKQTGALDLL